VRGPSSNPCHVGFSNPVVHSYSFLLLVSLPGSFVLYIGKVRVHCICFCVYEGVPVIVVLFKVVPLLGTQSWLKN
jgi:hypothetical protein